jgi:hypothetical protein
VAGGGQDAQQHGPGRVQAHGAGPHFPEIHIGFVR